MMIANCKRRKRSSAYRLESFSRTACRCRLQPPFGELKAAASQNLKLLAGGKPLFHQQRGNGGQVPLEIRSRHVVPRRRSMAWRISSML